MSTYEQRRPAHERVLARCIESDVPNMGSPCWVFIGSRNQMGYGKVGLPPADGLPKRTAKVHRVVYEALVGPIPDGMVIDHLCRQPSCVNPAHLEPVTRRENVLRGLTLPAANARKTHCKHGHEFTPENTYLFPTGTRGCRTCARAAKQREKRGAA